jgi:hypothetical protein
MGKENLPFRGAPGSLLPRLLDAAPEGILMVDFDLNLLLIPVGLALAFMLWVIWALEMQIRRDKHHRGAKPRANDGSDRPASSSTAPDERRAGPGGF